MEEPNGASAASPEASDETPPIIDIAPHGDLVLHISHNEATPYAFRVSTAALRSTSKYFARLLETGRFGEGSHIAATHTTLRAKYPTPAAVPSPELPSIAISDLGRISAVKSLSALLTDFLRILHALDLTTHPPPVPNLANLAIVADRFDALPALQTYTHRKKTFQTLEARTPPKLDLSLSPPRTRQRLLTALLLDCPLWLERYSLRLITKNWLPSPNDSFPNSPSPLEEPPLWHDLPHRLESELLFRRSAILSTLQALQTHFLTLYSSRTRQCRLGYDSSPECDAFQFGEMVRFFLRCGTLTLTSLIAPQTQSQNQNQSPDPEPEPLGGYTGDIPALIEKLKQVPEYQVDKNHSHCGLRTRLVPLLEMVGLAVQHAGVCGECWAKDRGGELWMEAKRPLVWKRGSGREVVGRGDCRSRHVGVREMFLAGERVWD